MQDADLSTLVKHALTALKESSQNGEINSKNTSISIVGVFRHETSSVFLTLKTLDVLDTSSVILTNDV